MVEMQSARLKREGVARHLLEARDFSRVRLHAEPLMEEMAEYAEEKVRCFQILKKYFVKIDEVVLPSPFTYDNKDDVLKDLTPCLKHHISFLERNKAKILECIEAKLQTGEMRIPHDGAFWRLGK